MTEPIIAAVDYDRSACLCDQGGAPYVAVTAVSDDGSTHYVLVDWPRITDSHYRPDCPSAPHEQDGPLPIEYVRRLTVAARTHRCGRPTKSGAPCRTPVHRQGDTCAWHRNRKVTP